MTPYRITSLISAIPSIPINKKNIRNVFASYCPKHQGIYQLFNEISQIKLANSNYNGVVQFIKLLIPSNDVNMANVTIKMRYVFKIRFGS